LRDGQAAGDLDADRAAGKAMSSPGRRPLAETASRISLRPIGSPLPLGMIALAGASLMFTGYQLSWLPPAQGHDVAVAQLAFAVPLQYLAAVFGFLGRDGAGGTGMALLGSCWLSAAILLLRSAPGSRSPALGLLLLFAAAALLVPAMASALGKVAATVAFVLAATRFALTGIYEYAGGAAWQHAAGWVGLTVCLTGLYNAFAFELEDTRHRTVLPVLRWGAGRRAMAGSVSAEVADVSQEAGVREQL
jgi:uncharacterized protein